MKFLMLAAIAPAVVLMSYIRKKDKIEPEPLGLIIKLLILGGISTIPASLFENIFIDIFDSLMSPHSLMFKIIENFFIIAFAEEFGKYYVMKNATWKSREFNYTYDAVVYAVAASLGFAAVENMLYVAQGGLSTALMRAITAVPGHCIFGVFMGYRYGIAKKAQCDGADRHTVKSLLRRAVIVPMFIHGFYDFCLSMSTILFIIIFFVFEMIITIAAIVKVRKLSKNDAPVAPEVTVYDDIYTRL